MTALAAMSFRGATEAARPSDIERLRELLESAVPDCHPDTARRIDDAWSTFRVIRDEHGVVIAAGALRPLGEDRAEIRGLVVAPEARSRGHAGTIVRALIDAAESLDLRTVCVTRRPEFFRRFGFELSDRAWSLTLRRRPVPAAGRPRVAMVLGEDAR